MAQGLDFLEDYEVLVVETPENLELRLPLAGFGPRFLAQLVDQLLLGVLALIFFALLLSIVLSYGAPGADPSNMVLTVIVVMILGAFACTLGYYLFFEFYWNGQTPGKRLVGIRVIRRGALPLTFREVLIRNLLRLVDWLPANGLIGLVSFFASRNQQRLGDLAADTVVVREFTGSRPFSWEATAGDILPGPLAGMLAPRLAYIIHSYLMRSASLEVAARLELSERIIQELGHESGGLSLRERENYLASILQMHLAGQR